MRPALTCPYCAAPVTEDERHILWHYACWSAERDTWLPWLQEATGTLLAPSTIVDNWPACLQHACLVPSWATEGVDPEQVDEFVYRLFGLALSVLMARMRAEQAASDRGHVGLLFPDMPRPGRGRTYLWQELVGPLPLLDRGPQLRLAPGLPRGWKWDRQLAADFVSWASVLRWREGEVSYTEPAIEFEATSGRALPARPEHALRMIVFPLQERAAVLRQAARALQPHLLVGRLLPAEESLRCHSLIALGGRTCLGLKGRPYFAARGEMVRMLEGLAAHRVTQWQRRLSRPLHAAPMADFLGGFFPPAPAGKAPLRPYQRVQRRPRCPPALPAEQSAGSGAAQPAAAQGVLPLGAG